MRPELISDTRDRPGGANNISRWFRAPVRDGNRFTLLSDAHVFFARMLAAIDASKHYVLAEFYLVESGQVTNLFIAAFARAAARGIRVRVLFDAFGARGLGDGDRARLRAAGVDLVFFNIPRWRAFPRVFVRDHRKLLVVDGTAGFTGGTGLTDMFSPDVQPDSYWWDCMVEIAGPVLDDWHALFARTWKRCAHRELDVVQCCAMRAMWNTAGAYSCGGCWRGRSWRGVRARLPAYAVDAYCGDAVIDGIKITGGRSNPNQNLQTPSVGSRPAIIN
jgi:phosphatidylserine/phosphatidylglycerophosphate/cardiolipin synthase-like enzyme